jgi:hypothetical protein
MRKASFICDLSRSTLPGELLLIDCFFLAATCTANLPLVCDNLGSPRHA